MDIETKKLQLLYYARRGWPVFPCYWVTDEAGRSCACSAGGGCKSPGKHPLTPNGFKDATVDIKQIQAWLGKYPLSNWAIRTGDRSKGGAGILVIDVDIKPHADPPVNGALTWELLRQEHPGPIETITQRTGSGLGGFQHLFDYPDGHDIRSGAGVLGPGIDIRANDGYIVCPPSTTKAPYKFELKPGDVELATLPEWVLELILAHQGKSANRPALELAGATLEQGRRHDGLVAAAASMRRVGMERDEIRAGLLALRDQRANNGDHPITDDEVDDIASWVAIKDREYQHTDLGNAERFIAQHGADVRFCYAWEKWLVWDGRRWETDKTGEVQRRGHLTVRSIYAEAANTDDDEKRKALVKHAVRSEARQRVENLLYLARPYVPISPDELDKDPMLINVNNGVIDLRTGALRPHRREHMITKLAPIEFDPAAECPRWDEFIKLVTGDDDELAWFLQLAVGYTLTGSVDEDAVFFLIGDGLNGKTVFSEALRDLLGDYAGRTKIEALLGRDADGRAANPYIADMQGARFVLASEVPEGTSWNESLLKDLTGGDVIKARHLFSNPFEFRPSHKLWIYGNYKPKVSGMDVGIWRRLKVIPFAVTIPENIRRPRSEVLHDFERERAGILAWAIVGCVSWQRDGLNTVRAVTEATAEYKTEQDLVAQFLAEKTLAHPDHQVDKDELYGAWRLWCEHAGETDGLKRSKKWFTHQMTKRGHQHGGDGNKMLLGLKVK